MEGAGQPLRRACALVGQRRRQGFAGSCPIPEPAKRSIRSLSPKLHRLLLASIIAGAVQAGVLTRFGVGTRSAWLLRPRPRTLAESLPATLTWIFETFVCRVFRDMRRFLALDVSSHSRDEHKSPSRLRRTGTRLRDNRSPTPISHRDRPACRPKPTPEAEIVGAQHRSGHVRDGRHPCRHCLEAPKSLRDNTNVDSDVSAGSGTFMPAASPVRRYPTTVSGSRSPGTTAGMPGGYGVICSAATRPTASQRAPAPPLRRTRRGAASPSLVVCPVIN